VKIKKVAVQGRGAVRGAGLPQAQTIPFTWEVSRQRWWLRSI